ncbi:uncharacterized protein N7511_009391 [Penicillium nucicola]|uniref:uncharacterized protein n=1 Tax=Penicillium nucicola TaxID=1850975 RepID=UPI002544E969|nr:uncharacterized protein N7511_009391 [Penicillium nucicola]KAJ5747695.1 hypothetical protein N7511_009391 [Penicillium nucicola]
MGRQAYLNRLALGRSPYEAPDTAVVDTSNPVRRVSSVHADSYMQQYDARGHPVNPESRTLGREFRRAKNDILSTMGIVVSGEDRKTSIPNEQQKINQIASENDFGLVITTLDQLLVFFGTWWTSSFTGRVQTYKHYAHSALLEVIKSERGATGVLGFYFAGIPAWAISSGLAIARESPLKRIFASLRDYAQYLTGESLGIRSFFGLVYTMAKSSVLMLSVEFYMYSILQSLSLVAPWSIPNAQLLIPFGTGSLLQLPALPTDISPGSLGTSLVGLLTHPGILAFVYGYYLRPDLEERIYRLIRRRLPKATIADELSVRVAFEENLIEWVVPTLGRKSDEEMYRSNLTLLEDIKCELGAFRNWVFSFFGLRSSQSSDQQAFASFRDERIESLRNSIEMLQNELEGTQFNSTDGNEPNDSLPRPSGIASDAQVPVTAPPRLRDATASTTSSRLDTNAGLHQVLTNENRMSQSPGEMSNDYFSEIATVERTSGPSTTSNQQDQRGDSQNAGSSALDRNNSRSNTLFSHPSSPETSPPTSPRVRASLIHQSSDIITMQLELLGNRNRNPQNQASNLANLNALAGNDAPGLNRHADAMDRRSIAEFLEALILSQAQRQGLNPPAGGDTDGFSSVTAGQSVTTPQELSVPEPTTPHQTQGHESDDELTALESIEEAPELSVPNILPDGVEEPIDEEPSIQPIPVAIAEHNVDTQSDTLHLPLPPTSRIPRPVTVHSSGVHRVTLLSAYPVDSLASNLAAAISGVILAPLEALFFRSLTQSWLTTHPSDITRLSDVHPLGLWFGGRTWPDIGAYMCRLVLMRGMHIAMRAGIWGFLVGSTMRIGRKFCGWGSL